MNTQEIDAHLDATTIRQLTWKPGTMRTIACKIVRQALTGEVWPDQINTDAVQPEDMNCIGTCYRNLTRAGIIEPTSDFRRSTASHSNGRKVFRYVLGRRSLAETFLQRNGETVIKQQTELQLK